MSSNVNETLLYQVKVWTFFVAGFATTMVFVPLLVRILRMGKNNWLIMQVFMLIFANIGLILTGYGHKVLYLDIGYSSGQVPPEHQEEAFKAIWLIGIGTGLAEGLSAVVHFLLADKYQTIARDIPTIVLG
jgi:multisubunit Na+/H+ antiporter MnhC subunit